MGERTVRLVVGLCGLLLLVITNFSVAMQLQERPPRPIVNGVGDIVNNEGWLLASYQMYPWWLSEIGVAVSVSRLGSAHHSTQVRLEHAPITFDNVTLNYDEDPLRLDDAGVLRAQIESRYSLTEGHRVRCRPAGAEALGVCDFNIAFDAAELNNSQHLDLVTVELAAREIVLVDCRLLSDLCDTGD